MRDCGTSALPSQQMWWRMPRKRSGLAVMCASSTSDTAAPSRRSACPTMPVAARVSPYSPLALCAAMPPTNSVSPTGRSDSGPSARYIAPHSTNTVWRTLCPATSSNNSSRK